MTLVPDVPRVDVEADHDALDVHVDPAPPGGGPDERGITHLADARLQGSSDTVATVRLRGPGGFHYAVIVARGVELELVPLEPDGDGFAARIRVAGGETVFLVVVSSDFERGMDALEAEVARGGMGATRPQPFPRAFPPPDLGGVIGGPPGGPVAGQRGGLVIGGAVRRRSTGLAPGAPVPLPPVAAPAPAPPRRRVPPPSAGAAAAPPPAATPANGGAAQPRVAPSAGVDGATRVPAFVDAEIPSRLEQGTEFDAVVRVSLEDLVPTAGTAHAKASARFDPTRDIEVAVQLRGLSLAPGQASSQSTPLPATARRPRKLTFRLVPEDPGRGHITVKFTQPPSTEILATLAVSAPIHPAGAGAAGPDGRHVAKAGVAVPPRSIADLPTLTIEESIAGGKSELTITAKIGGTVARHTAHLPDDATGLPDKAAYVGGIYAELARIRTAYEAKAKVDDPTAAPDARRDVRTLGARIARELLGDDVNSLLWNRRRRMSQVVLQTSGELDIPWEMVHLVPVGTQRPDKERFFLGDLGLMRWMYGTPRPTVIPLDPGKVIAIAPSYANRRLRLPRAREEVTLLERLLERKPLTAEDSGQLHDAIVAGDFDLLHFAGHGRWRDLAPLGQEIAFAKFSLRRNDPTASYTDSDARRDMPETDDDGTGGRAAPPAPFVFLSACDVGRLRSGATGLGGFAEVFLRGGVGVFIGCSWAVRDDVTAEFVSTFYEEALRNKATLGEAVLAARRAAREAGDLTSLAFTVFADPRARLKLSR
ncbi:CHAT domain-containing protein [Microbacterium sp. NPDC056569]|uniref:CHAT domain-containing protein n=1 Tax=Microbacterium sp. NPDC056569 TaxID=3345867 RepID=UPI00367011C3